MLAMQTGHEEMAVGAEEAGAWLKSAQNVMRHYSVETTQKTIDWLAFCGVTAQVFGTRAVAIAVKNRNARPNNVRPLRAVAPENLDIQPN